MTYTLTLPLVQLFLSSLRVLPAFSVTLGGTHNDGDVCLFGLTRQAEQAVPEAPQPSGYHWWRRGGNGAANSGTTAVAPDLSQGPSWVWANTLNETLRHSPLIDDKLDVYLQSSYHIRKFTADGKLVWTWKVGAHNGVLPISPVLHAGRIYSLSAILATGEALKPVMWVLDMETGEVLLTKALSKSYSVHSQTSSLFVEDGRLIAAVYDSPTNPITSVLAMDANTLDDLWVYRSESVLWNFMPASVGDGTILFSSGCGKAMRIRLRDGQEIWRAGNLTAPPRLWCSTGGGVLGGDGNFYAEYNHLESGSPIAQARVAAFRVSDGTMLWQRSLGGYDAVENSEDRRSLVDYGGWQYPAVGHLGGQDKKRRAVVVAIGGATGPPPAMTWTTPLPDIARDMAWNAYLSSPLVRKNFMEAPDVPNAVVALDPMSGGVIWRYELPVWDHFGSNQDEAGLLERVAALQEKPSQTELLCMPDNQGIPVIAGDGTVYASDSHRGGIYAIKDVNEDGIITDEEVTFFDTGVEFLNSPAVAPGMLVAAPCYGDVYAFRS